MGLIRQFLRDYGYIHRTDLARNTLRAYAAASMGRLTGDWLQSSVSIDQDIRSGLVQVRGRARDLSQNNEYARAYLRSVRKNIVGSEGFSLQVRAMQYNGTKMVPDRPANGIIEKAFARWSRPETATVTGKHSFRKVQELVVEGAARDGEAFVRLVKGASVNRFGFALQIVEPDWIDVKHTEELKNGNVIRMGVEQDQWRRPVAYYVSTRASNMELYGITDPAGPVVRIPAGEMIHIYDAERSDQTRGMSWMAPAMLGLHNLKGYVEAAVINARIGASKMGFFGDQDGSTASYTGDAVDGSGNKITSVEPGIFEDIGPKKFYPFDPKYPDGQFDPFTKSILRGISAGLGISFSSISNDLTEVNFSSIRAGLIEERETWKTLQSWFVETFLNRVFSEWLYMSLFTGGIDLPMSKYDKFNNPKWTGRRWAWVDPLKDVQASMAARAAGFKSATQVINEMGGDIEELYQEIKEEKELAEEYELEFDYGGKGNGDTEDPDEGGTDNNPDKGNGQGKGADGRTRVLL